MFKGFKEFTYKMVAGANVATIIIMLLVGFSEELGIGKLIGAPVAGTMTAVWWETLMDNTLVFGIPQVGCRDMRGVFGENTQLNPDIEVYNSPEDFINGLDTQLERAVKEMMKK